MIGKTWAHIETGFCEFHTGHWESLHDFPVFWLLKRSPCNVCVILFVTCGEKRHYKGWRMYLS